MDIGAIIRNSSGHVKVAVESDALVVVNNLYNSREDYVNFGDLLLDVSSSLYFFSGTKLDHVGQLGLAQLVQGLRDDVFLAKWGWKCLNHEKSLWGKLVQSKYLRGNDFELVEAGKKDSWLWKAVLRSRDLLKLGACRWVQRGGVLDVWDDPWIPTIVGFKPRPRDPALTSQSVGIKDLITNSGGWNLSVLNQLFDDETTRAILKMPVSTSQANGTKWMLALSASGTFTVKSLYQNMIFTGSSRPLLDAAKFWRAVWKANIHSRHKLLG
ncbi:hypothetical protein TorRG33x02_185990 [Trema orientale]|uniref:Uncharacterized protein n=1 Tax=Trema orientale TaxID=63057 RepID=A0A2P5EJ72_TREOI|nr:hypothetical protein TorRG33x02_185990 [Trema orientale]